MVRNRIVWTVLITSVLVLALASPVLAHDGEPPGRIVFGEDFTLEAGESIDGDLVVFGGDVWLEEDSRVEGEMVVWGGDADIAGTVEGDLVVMGGSVTLRETGVVEGDLVTAGGEVEREEGAVVEGQEVTAPEVSWRGRPVVIPFVGQFPLRPRPVDLALRVAWEAVRLVLTVLVMAGLGGVVAMLWPQPTARVGRAYMQALLPGLGLGLLTVLVILGLLISLCLTVVGLAAGAAAAVAAVFGWAALGALIGERLFAARPLSPFWSAALGTGLLTLLSELLGLIPCVGWLGGFLVACVGLGVVILTRFGTSDYPPLDSASVPPVSSPAPALGEEE